MTIRPEDILAEARLAEITPAIFSFIGLDLLPAPSNNQ